MNYYKPTSLVQKIHKILQLFWLHARISSRPVSRCPGKSLSILMVVPEFDRIGGYELQAAQLSRSLSNQDHFLTVVTDERNGASREFRQGFLVHRLANKIVGLSSFLLQRRHYFNVVHVHGICGFSLLAIRLASFFGIQTVLKVATRGDVRSVFHAKGFKHRIYRKWFRNTSVFIAVSNELREELELVGVEKSHICMLPNFVDTGRFRRLPDGDKHQLRKQEKVTDQQTVFLYIGRLEKRKGVDVLLKAWKNAGVLWIVGNGPEADRLHDLSAELNLQNVFFFGATTDPLPFYQAADVFVLPSLAEGAPNVLLEAMSCGLPVIATRIGGIVDQVDHQQQGLLVSPESSEELSAAMEYAASHPDQRKKWSKEAEIRAREKFDIREITARYLELYRKLRDSGRML